MGELNRGRRTGVMLGLSALALTTSMSAAGIGSSAADQSPEGVATGDATADSTAIAQLSSTETVGRRTPEVPALEVGATPLGARRPMTLDNDRPGTLPGPAAYAYTFASSALEEAEPGCGLEWSLLAAIGRVESDHGRTGASTLDDQGVVAPAVRGARLDGSSGTSVVFDTDAGDLDDNLRFDRAVGPMQLLPSTWGVVGVDADGDGLRNPDDIDDAALGAAVLLCGAPGRLTDRDGLVEALERYNAAPGYAAAVIDLERAYRRSGVPVANLGTGSAVLPTAPSAPAATFDALVVADTGATPPADKGDDRTPGSGGPSGGPSDGPKRDDNTGKGDGDGKGDGPKHEPSNPGEPTKEPSNPGEPTKEPTDPGEPTKEPTDPGQPTEEPTDPGQPTEEPEPTPTCLATGSGSVPTTPNTGLSTLGGVLGCEGAWTVAGTPVLVGDSTWLATGALADHDADGAVETNLAELTGLVGATVTVEIDTNGTVWTLQGHPYFPVPAPVETPEASPTATPTASPTATPKASPTATPKASPTAGPTAGPTGSPKATAKPTAKPTSSASPTE